MVGFSLRHLLPRRLCVPLWGDRDRWGLIHRPEDPCWQEWQKNYADFYHDTQRSGIGNTVNEAGYTVMSGVDLQGKTVLEVGAGDIKHSRFWKKAPKKYVLADISEHMMALAEKHCRDRDLSFESIMVERNQRFPLGDNSVDVIVSFYSLEHLHPLRPYLDEMKRLLKPGGVFIGALPAEGGLAWGMGRYLTSRRWIKQNTTINYDKIICWEHPNFADQILAELDQVFVRSSVTYWPFQWVPLLDFNLIVRFLYIKPVE